MTVRCHFHVTGCWLLSTGGRLLFQLHGARVVLLTSRFGLAHFWILKLEMTEVSRHV